jgi:glycerol kinase
MVIWGFEIGELLAAALRYRYLNFRPFCIKIILKGLQKSEITDCDTRGCGMWDITV